MIGLNSLKLLSTKLNQPRRKTRLVHRERLFASLEKGRQRKLILVCGPAGSGKTTLISDWLRHIDLPSAWLSLEDADNDMRRFLSYLVEACRRVVPSVGKGAESLLTGPDRIDPQIFVENFILHSFSQESEESIIVLDDLHSINNREIQSTIDFLIQHKTDNIHLIVASRSVNPLSLAKLRLQDQVLEITGDELRFQMEEAKQFYHEVMELELDSGQIASLQRYTEGWIAASQLSALRLHKASDCSQFISSLSSNGNLIAEYLFEEVLSCQEQSLREFLLATSVLRRMCDSLCAAVLGEDGPRLLLASLERSNLFVVSIEGSGDWYRYHGLFANLLRRQLKAQMPELEKVFHLRASKWFADEGLIYEAADHAEKAGEMNWLAELIERWYLDLIFRGETITLANWLNVLGEQIVHERPILAVAKAVSMSFLHASLDIIEESIDQAEHALDKQGDDLVNAQRAFLHYTLCLIRTFTAFRREDHKLAIELSEKARLLSADESLYSDGTLDLISGSSELYLGKFDDVVSLLDNAMKLGYESENYLVAFAAVASKSMFVRMQSRRREAQKLCEDAIRFAEEKNLTILPALGAVYLELGLVFFLKGDFERSICELEKGIKTQQWIHSSPQIAVAYGALAHAKLSLGKGEEAETAMRKCRAYEGNAGYEDIPFFCQALGALFDLRRGDIASAQKWANGLDNEYIPTPMWWLVTDYAKIIVKIVSQSYEEALEHIELSREYMMKIGIEKTPVALFTLRAVALARMGRHKEAAVQLDEAAMEAFPEDIGSCFKFGAKDFAPLLEYMEDGQARSFVVQILNDCGVQQIQGSEDSPNRLEKKTKTDREKRLSERELEVLALIAGGMSNREVASRIKISVSTVKTHLHHIFAKLGVENRTEAVHMAQECGMIIMG